MPKKLPFLTSPDSPFPDHYDLGGEATVLKHLIESDEPDTSDPLFPRLVEYEERLQALDKLKAARAAKAARTAGLREQVAAIGALTSEDEDSMTVHTRDAMRLFQGRPAGDGLRAIAGGRRVAASLRQLWALSANDNPYADWLLVQFDESMQKCRADMKKQADRLIQLLDALRSKGLAYSVLRSDNPATVTLGFVSPYGYAVASAVVEFDWSSRVVKSAQRRDVIGSTEAHEVLFQLKRDCRAIFEPMVRGAGLLMREELRQLTRADFMSADADAMKRVAAVQGLFGHCPRDVFVGTHAPRHTRRSVRLTEQEMRLLETVPFAEPTVAGPTLIE